MLKIVKYYAMTILLIIVLAGLGYSQDAHPPHIIQPYWIVFGLLTLTAVINVELYRRKAKDNEQYFWRKFGINLALSFVILSIIIWYIAAKDPILLCLLTNYKLTDTITDTNFFSAFTEVLFNFSLFLAANAFTKGESLWSSK